MIHPRPQRSLPSIRILAIGNAGINVVDRAVVHSAGELPCVAINTDAQSLTASVIPQRLLIGQQTARGLGTGGDTQLAIEAANESSEDLNLACQDTDILILIGSLGGGTGSILLPHLASQAKQRNCTVFVITTLPFSFEGPRRSQLAADALEKLHATADLVIVFENDRMTELADPVGPLAEAFSNADALLVLTLESLLAALQGSGPLNISAADLLKHLQTATGPQWFAYAQSSSPNRAHDVVAQALKSPLLARDANFAKANSLLVHLRGPQNLAFVEVQAILQGIIRQVEEDAAVSLGISTCNQDNAPLQLSIFACVHHNPPLQIAKAVPQIKASSAKTPTAANGTSFKSEQAHPVHVPATATIPDAELMASVRLQGNFTPGQGHPYDFTQDAPLNDSPISDLQELFDPTDLPPPIKASAPAPSKKPVPKITQETLPFEPVDRGRFEKSEPTIIEGEDLDVPTFLRRRIRIK